MIFIPAQIAEMQVSALNKAGLDSIEKDGKKVDVATVLRDPKQRGAFIESLEKSAASSVNPETKETISNMVKASRTFVEMEEKRMAMLTASNDPAAVNQVAQADVSRQRQANASALSM